MLELDCAPARALEEPDAVADEDRGDVDDDLIEKAGLESLPGDVRAENDHVGAPGRLLGERYRPLDRDVDELAGDALDHGRLGGRVVTKNEERPTKGAAIEPRLQPILDVLRPPTDQQGSRPPQDLVDRLPSSSPSSPNAQLMSSFGPAMNPSRLIIVCQSTLPISHGLPVIVERSAERSVKRKCVAVTPAPREDRYRQNPTAG